MENEPSNLAQSQKKADEVEQFLVPSVEKSQDLYFKKVTELQTGDIIIEKQCKLCMHPLRADAEAKWEQTKGNSGRGNCSFVVRFLNDKSTDIKFNHPNVASHMNNHYEQQRKRMWLREYGCRLGEIMNYKVSKEQSFEMLKQALQLKFFEAAADPHLETPKQADMMTKLVKSILEIEVIAAKLRGEIDTVEVYKQKFQSLIVNLITSEDDKVRQREMLEKVDRFKDEIVQ